MKSVVLRAPVLTQSGYGTHARQIAAWLLNLEKSGQVEVTFEPVVWGATAWYVDPDACGGLIGEILQRSTKKESYDVAISLQLPNEWNPFLAKYNIGMTAGVETDICNPEWIDAVNRMDLVIVPSEFTKQTFLRSGEVKTNIEVVPESWLSECRSEPLKTFEEKLNLETDFNFLVVSQFTGNNPENDRKNIAYTIKWLIEEFKDNPDVGVILKTNFGRNTSLDKRNVAQILSQIVGECKKGVGPKIYLVHGHMNNEEIVSLYKSDKVKALINLTRGEGFGLPILEAAVCGLPVITTDWSAHTEFLNQGKFIKIDYSMIDIHQTRVDNQIFVPKARWANPLEEDFKKKVKKFYKSSATPKLWAKELQVKLLESHSPEKIQERYTEVLKDVL